MFRFHGGQTVRGGFYWHRATWRLVTIEGMEGVLPGEADGRYLRVPALLLIPLALAMGGLFVLFLPLIGFLLLGEWAVTAGGSGLRRWVARGKALRAPAAGR